MFQIRRPHPTSRGDEAEKSSVGHLQELYTVTVGLALTVSVERVLPAEGHGAVDLRASLVFVAFVATVIPFYHGAQRHLDFMYVFRPHRADRGRGLFFGDFVFLFVEACLLIGMGASVESPQRFMAIWVALLVLDVVWLLVFVLVSSRLDDREAGRFGWQEYGWAVVNVPALAAGGVFLSLVDFRSSEALTPALVMFVLALIRSSCDYAWNWDIYFPGLAPDDPCQSVATSSVPSAEQ